MRGWINSAASGPRTWTHSNATWTAWIKQHQRKRKQHRTNRTKGSRGGEHDPTRAVRAWSGDWGAGKEGRREVDADPRQRAASCAGEGLAGTHGSCTSARVGAVRNRCEPGQGRKRKAHLGR